MNEYEDFNGVEEEEGFNFDYDEFEGNDNGGFAEHDDIELEDNEEDSMLGLDSIFIEDEIHAMYDSNESPSTSAPYDDIEVEDNEESSMLGLDSIFTEDEIKAIYDSNENSSSSSVPNNVSREQTRTEKPQSNDNQEAVASTSVATPTASTASKSTAVVTSDDGQEAAYQRSLKSIATVYSTQGLKAALEELIEFLKQLIAHLTAKNVIENGKFTKPISKAEKLKKDLEDVKEQLEQAKDNQELIADVLINNHDTIQECYSFSAELIGNVVDELHASGVDNLEDIRNILSTFSAKEHAYLDSARNNIKITSAENIEEVTTEAFFGETYRDNEEVIDSENSIAALYKTRNGQLILALNENGGIKHGKPEYDENSHTLYYQIKEDDNSKLILEPFGFDSASMKNIVENMEYVSNDKEILKEYAPKLFQLSRVENPSSPKNELLTVRIQNIALSLYNKKLDPDKRNIISELASRELSKEFIGNKADLIKDISSWVKKAEGLSESNGLYSAEFMAKACDVKNQVEQITAKADSVDMSQIDKLENSIKELSDAFIHEQEVAVIGFHEKPIKLDNNMISCDIKVKDGATFEQTAIKCINDYTLKTNRKEAEQAQNALNRIRPLAEIYDRTDKVIDDGQVQRCLTHDLKMFVYNKYSDTLLIAEPNRKSGTISYNAYLNVLGKSSGDLNTIIKSESYKKAAPIPVISSTYNKDNVNISIMNSISDSNISNIVLDKAVEAYAIGFGDQNNLFRDSVKEAVVRAKGYDRLPEETISLREMLYNEIKEELDEKYHNTHVEERPSVTYVPYISDKNVVISIPHGDESSADKFYINFDDEGRYIKDFGLKIGNDDSVPAIRFDADDKRIDFALAETLIAMTEKGYISQETYFGLKNDLGDFSEAIGTVLDNYDKQIEEFKEKQEAAVER